MLAGVLKTEIHPRKLLTDSEQGCGMIGSAVEKDRPDDRVGDGGGRLAEGAADTGLEDMIEGMQVREMEAFKKTGVAGRGLPRWR